MTKRFLSIFTFVLFVLNSFAQESTLVINTEFPVTFDSWSVSFLIEKTRPSKWQIGNGEHSCSRRTMATGRTLVLLLCLKMAKPHLL